MRAYRDKRQVRNFIYSPLSLIILTAILILFGRSVWKAYAKERLSRAGEQAARAELLELGARKDKTQKQLEELNTPEGKEAELRDKFQVAWPGEEMVIITQPDPKKSE